MVNHSIELWGDLSVDSRKNGTLIKAYHGSRRHGKLTLYAARLKAAATLRRCRSSSQKILLRNLFREP